MDEEDGQGSSRESECGGEKAKDITSLEAPDDEGEWCWPTRNKITRWMNANGPKTSISLPC